MDTLEHENNESQNNSSHALDTVSELIEIAKDRQRRDAAWELYKGYDEDYEQANAERVARGV